MRKLMTDRLLVGVLGNRNAGKSRTWNALFHKPVRRGKTPHRLVLRPGECVEAFLVSGSFEEQRKYAGDILDNQDCRIVLCSMQYTEKVDKTIEYLIGKGFFFYVQWLNPGHRDSGETWDRLGLVNRLLSVESVLSIRSGRVSEKSRVQEIREYIYGWALYRKLILPC
jgi:hypothetical protein